MRKKEILAGQKRLLEEIAALREENLQMRQTISELPETVPERPVPENPEEDVARAHQFSRFPILRSVDERYPGYPREAAPPGKDDAIALAELAVHLQGYAAAHFGLRAGLDLFAALLGAMAVSRLVALTGKAAAMLPEAAASALGRLTELIPPRQGLFGSMDAVTKRCHETRLLRVIYEAGYQSAPCFAVINDIAAASPEDIARLAGMGPEPSQALRLAGSAWPGDPVMLREGALPYPDNLWIFGVAREAASASPMRLHVGGGNDPMEIPYGLQPIELSNRRLRELLRAASEEYPLPEEIGAGLIKTAEYLAGRLDMSIDAQTERQMPGFIGVCLACGLRPVSALDAFFYHKALRRLEYADPFLLRYELPGLQRFLEDTFGKNGMPLMGDFIKDLQKND